MNGSLEFNGQQWRVSLAPNVATQFRRVFKQISPNSKSPFLLSDNSTTAADLDWFMYRYPLDVSDQARSALDSHMETIARRKTTLDAITRPDWTPPTETGFRAGEEPDAYQSRAAAIMRQTGRLLLLDDLGLGKTVSALAVIADGFGLPAAIVVQPHVATQWSRFIRRFTHLRVFEVKDRNVRRLPAADVYLFRYSNIGAWAIVVETLGIKTVIFDEIQELRHGRSTQKGEAAESFVESAEYRMGLTATPIYNYGSEIFNVVEYIEPGALGSWHEFILDWCIPHGTHWIVKEPEALGAHLDSIGLTLRRTIMSPEVKITLPPLAEPVLVEVDWNEGDAHTNDELRRVLAMRVLGGSFVERGHAARELDLLVRQETGIAKARSVAAYVDMLLETGDIVLLAGWHRAVYDIWLEALSHHNPAMFTGTETASQKNRSRDAIMRGDTNLLILSLRSGAGLDGLQERGGGHAVLGEFDWSPQVHTQFIGRLQRRGQTQSVQPHYPWVNGGSDPVLMETLGLKSSQSEGIINPYGGAPAPRISETRMKSLAKAVLGEADVVPFSSEERL